jgi:hypothetical protein
LPDFRIHLSDESDRMIEAELESFTREIECEIEKTDYGFRLMPEYMLRIHGIFMISAEYGWMIAREEEATSWEDYLFVKLAHYLTARLNGMLFFGESIAPMDAAPEKFETFDHYVATAVEKEEGMFKETKKHWLYTHRKRTLR